MLFLRRVSSLESLKSLESLISRLSSVSLKSPLQLKVESYIMNCCCCLYDGRNIESYIMKKQKAFMSLQDDFKNHTQLKFFTCSCCVYDADALNHASLGKDLPIFLTQYFTVSTSCK